ncbi:MAG: RNA 2',3'-cyclic phosphodiesterase [Myxococcaceae bacterium]
MRLFVAVDLDQPTRAAIPAGDDARVRWSARDKLHLTLVFLGDVSDDREPQVKQLCAEVAARHRPLKLTVEGAGTFGHPPRVLWLGIGGELDKLRALRAELFAGLEVKDEHPDYSPHLTLGRSKRDHGDRALDELAQPLKATRLGPFAVDSAALYQTSGGRYLERARFPLGARDA